MCTSNAHAGVSATNDSGGYGVWARGTPGGHFESNGSDGVVGLCFSNAHAGVSAINDRGGFGVWARGTPAGHFEANVEVTGILNIGGFPDVAATIRFLIQAVGSPGPPGPSGLQGPPGFQGPPGEGGGHQGRRGREGSMDRRGREGRRGLPDLDAGLRAAYSWSCRPLVRPEVERKSGTQCL